jgi:hypothetical protein
VSPGILGGVANVEYVRARVTHRQDLVEIDGMENLLEILVERSGIDDEEICAPGARGASTSTR